MKLSPADYEMYYESLGIKESDLASPQPVDLAELPPDNQLTDTERHSIGGFLRQWNQMDARMKVDAAQAMERRVLKGRDPEHVTRMDAWTAYLLLGRVRGCEARRELMQRVARGEKIPPAPRSRRRSPRPEAAAGSRNQDDARLRATGNTRVIIEPIQVKTANGGTMTIHYMRPRRG